MEGGREERVALKQPDKQECGEEGPPWLVIWDNSVVIGMVRLEGWQLAGRGSRRTYQASLLL